ncbi:MAG: lactonase family protein [Bacteroidales bacterium]|jgi:6-phosphogluconolactonase|nr:lactonase family protein [Bacteroidales bacterium]
MRKIVNLLIVALIPVFSCVNSQTSRMYVGAYTSPDNPNGLHIIDVDLAKGVFTPVSQADAGANPSYLCISQKRSMAYAINESSRVVDGIRVGSVTALKLDIEAGTAEKVKALDVPNGGPCFVSLMPGEDFLLVANYGGGSIAVVRLDASGLPSEVTDTLVFREEGIRSARGHMAAASPDGKKVYLTCLSLDKVMILDLDRTTGKLTQTGHASVKEGLGPRHFTFSKDGTKMFVISELVSAMTVFDIAADGSLTEIQTISTLPDDWTGESFGGDVHLSKDGAYLYGSNRGHNSIVTYKVGANGMLSVVGYTSCGGNWPRNFTIDPSGKYLLVGNQNARPQPDLQNQENVALFEIDKNTGMPVVPGKIYDIKAPACLKFME